VWSRFTFRSLGQDAVGSIAEEFGTLSGELDAWLADRERRYPQWPEAEEDEADTAEEDEVDAAGSQDGDTAE